MSEFRDIFFSKILIFLIRKMLKCPIDTHSLRSLFNLCLCELQRQKWERNNHVIAVMKSNRCCFRFVSGERGMREERTEEHRDNGVNACNKLQWLGLITHTLLSLGRGLIWSVNNTFSGGAHVLLVVSEAGFLNKLQSPNRKPQRFSAIFKL